MAGMTAQAVAVRAPEIVAGLVIANTGHRRDDQGRAAMNKRASDLEQRMPAVVRATLARWFDSDFQPLRPNSILKVPDWLFSADPVVQAWFDAPSGISMVQIAWRSYPSPISP